MRSTQRFDSGKSTTETDASPAWSGLLRRTFAAAALIFVALFSSTLAGTASAGDLPPGGPTTPAVSAGGDYNCVARTDQTIYCWGDGEFGQLEWPEAETFTQVSAGNRFACAVRTDGSIACWGNSAEHGQTTPKPGTYTQVSAGGVHACAVATDQTLACWGYNMDWRASPPPGTFKQVSAGVWHSCAVATDETIACWGLGFNTIGPLTAPPGNFTQVSVGNNYACGVKTDGTIACWGDDEPGQSPPLAGTFTQVSAGDHHYCGVRTDGTIACQGSNDFGQATPLAGNFAQVSAGGRHTCAVRTDQTIACWGDDEFGQGSPPKIITPLPPRKKMLKMSIKGPTKARLGRAVAFRVKLLNFSGTKATYVYVQVVGMGTRRLIKLGTIAPGTAKTAKVRLRPKKKGKFTLKFVVSSSEAIDPEAKRVVRVRK